MPGAPAPEYIAARRVLLDALEAAKEHLDSLVLVGAQAVYLHTGEAELSVAPFTTDGDLAIDPGRLGPDPLIEIAMTEAGFVSAPNAVGAWAKTVQIAGTPHTVPIDLLVPASLGGAGRRAARIPPHGQVARKVEGLEAALVDKDRRKIAALDPDDPRRIDIWVAGPAGLLVAKIHKIVDRADERNRTRDKDALDVYRLLSVVSTEEFVSRMRILESSDIARTATAVAIENLEILFAKPKAAGCLMAVRAAGPLMDPDTLTASLVVLSAELMGKL
jgi:predicted nucleotidyltransferase